MSARPEDTISQNVPAVELRNVCASYDSPGAIIHNANLTIAQGEFFAFIGPNGGGKTTLVKVILGLVAPSSGQALVFGEPAGRHLRHISYVPQFATCRRDFPMTVKRMVGLALQNVPSAPGLGSASDDHHRICEALERVGLSGEAQQTLGQLSGGQLQRALIARALVRDPRLLILDEPTASVDPGGETSLLKLFEELSRHMTIVMVSHDVHYVLRSVGRVACINREVVVHAASDLEGVDTGSLYGNLLKPVVHNHGVTCGHGQKEGDRVR